MSNCPKPNTEYYNHNQGTCQKRLRIHVRLVQEGSTPQIYSYAISHCLTNRRSAYAEATA